MKKMLLTLALVIAGYYSYAQSPIYTTAGYGANYNVDGAYLGWNISGGGGETNFVNNIGGGTIGGFTFDNTTRSNAITRLMTILGNGNIGIGTKNPQATLSIKGNTLPTNQWSGYSSSLQVGEFMIQDYGIIPQVGISQNAYYDGVASRYILNGYASGLYLGANGSITFSVFNSGTSGTTVTGTGTAMVIANNGNIGIGTQNPDSKLTVAGSIHVTEVLVDQTVQQPDYVFDKDYDLTSLKEVKTYIDKNHHLPEIPSAAQVAKEGINLGEMNTKLLKKIEELTLYLLEKDKQLNEQQNVNRQLDARLRKLEKQILKNHQLTL